MNGFLFPVSYATGNSAHGEFYPTEKFVEKVLAAYVMKT
jgi:hypothetical protein